MSTSESKLGERFRKKGPSEENDDGPPDQREGDGVRELKEPQHLTV
jgi:hypothetical protein